MSEFLGKTVLVTGASKGIGAAIAKAFGAAGARVAIGYGRDRAAAERVAAEVAGTGGEALVAECDLRSTASVESFAEAARARFGPVDVLVNNAGAFAYRSLAETTEEHYRDIFDVNVLGMLMATKFAVARFELGGGSVINVSSLSALGNAPGRAVYAASKAAVNAITKVHALELAGNGIRVNGVMPGYVDTEGARAFGIRGTDQEARLLAATPLGHRPGAPSEIASAVLFLASSASGWITGEILTVSGGLR